MNAFGGFKIAGNSTSLNVPAAGVTLTSANTNLAAATASQHGDGSVSVSATTGRATLKAGVYKVDARLTVEGEFTSGTSGDAIGVVTGQLYVAGSAVSGTKGKVHTQAEGQAASLAFGGIIEITAAQVAAGTNYVEAKLLSGDASGNDVIVSEGQIEIVRLDG